LKREFSRKSSAPAYQVDIAQFEVLWNELNQQLGDSGQNHLSATLDIGSESVTIESPGDLSVSGELPDRVFDFRLRAANYSNNRTITILSSRARARVEVLGPDAAWVAGAMEVVSARLVRYQPWYTTGLIYPIAKNGGFIFYMAALSGGMFFLMELISRAWMNSGFTLVAMCIFGSLAARWDTLFPGSILVIRKPRSWFDEHANVVIAIGTAILAVAAVVTVIHDLAKPSTLH
jgi:hypothetical protein